MKVAGYMRVSTDHQNNENQKIRLEEFATQRGYDIFAIYEDTESGGKRNRPGLEKMLKRARRGHFNMVIAVKIDRIARSLQDLLEIAGKLGEYNVGLSFTDQDIDIGSSQGKLLFQILGAFAEFERDMIRERTKAGIERARRQKKHIGRPKVNGAKVVKVRRLREEGMSMNRIAHEVGIGKGSVVRILKEEYD